MKHCYGLSSRRWYDIYNLTTSTTAGSTKTRLPTWSTTPEFRGIGILWKCAKCFTTDGNSGPLTPVGNPKTDALRVAELLKTKTVENTGYAKRDAEVRTLMQPPEARRLIPPLFDFLGKF